MTLKDKKILVSGGAGFIGSHLIDTLLKLNNQVTVIDNLSTGNLNNLNLASKSENFKFIKGDIRDFDLVKKNLNDIEILFHEAALGNVQMSIDDPFTTHDVNVNGTLNLLLAANQTSVDRFIFASSSSVYGDSSIVPLNEEMELKPISPYALTKLTCEHYLSVFYEVYGLKTTSLRYFNVFGPRQPDNQYSGVISHSMLKIIKNEPLIIFGDGLQTRDFIYVNDVVNANLLTAENKFAIGQIFNVGSGTGISIIDLTKEIIKLFNSKIKYKFSRPRFGDIKDSLADIAKIKKILGFKPKILLQEGLKKIYEWFKKEKRY